MRPEFRPYVDEDGRSILHRAAKLKALAWWVEEEKLSHDDADRLAITDLLLNRACHYSFQSEPKNLVLDFYWNELDHRITELFEEWLEKETK